MMQQAAPRNVFGPGFASVLCGSTDCLRLRGGVPLIIP